MNFLKLRRNRKNQNLQGEPAETSGFTIIEVMLVLGLTGLLLIGLITNTFSSIHTQRYNDSVRSFAEFLRTMYSEAISPQSLGVTVGGNSWFGQGGTAILGKIIVFGVDYGDANEEQREETRSAYYATVIGNARLPQTSGEHFLVELQNAQATIYCGQNQTTLGDATTQQYLPLWDAEFTATTNPTTDQFEGSILIVQSPSTGVVHTAYTSQRFDLLNACQNSNTTASTQFQNFLRDHRDQFATQPIEICLKSPSINNSLYREIRIATDGRNTSAVEIVDLDSPDNHCR